MLPGEETWLAAVVANLSDDTTKLVYADWLEEHGDDRAGFLRAFVAAARAGNWQDFPKPKKKYPEEWLELIGFRLLHGLAVQGLLASLTKPVLQLARPALRMLKTPNKRIAVGASKIGGCPDLPRGYDWPLGMQCGAICNSDTRDVYELSGFLAQVNLAEVSHSQATKGLPKSGLLSFFGFQDLENDDPDVVGVAALWFPNVDGLVRTEPPEHLTEGNEIIPPARLTFEETLDLPEGGQYEDGPWGQWLAAAGETDVRVVADYRVKNFENMLGYARSTSGGDPTPSKRYRHLILLENAGGCRLHIQISKKNLASLNFDRIKLAWVDFD